MSPARPDPRRRARGDAASPSGASPQETARQRGQARAGADQDRRGPGQGLPQGERPARAGLHQGQQEGRRRRCSSEAGLTATGFARFRVGVLRDRASVTEDSSDMTTVPSSASERDVPRSPRDRRVLLKLSGEAFGGGQVGVDPDVVSRVAREIAAAAEQGVQVGIVVGGGNFFRGAELSPARHGAGPRGLHGHARHGDELPGPAGLPRAGRLRHPRADRHHHGPGRGAVHPAPRDPAPGEGPRRDLRRRRRPALLLHRHRRPPSARWRSRPTSSSWARTAWTASTPPTRARTPRRRRSRTSRYQDALRQGLKVVDATAFSLLHGQRLPMVVFGMEGAGNITRALVGERIGTLVTG